MEKITYKELRTNPKYAEGSKILHGWGDTYPIQSMLSDKSTIFYDIELFKKIDAKNYLGFNNSSYDPIVRNLNFLDRYIPSEDIDFETQWNFKLSYRNTLLDALVKAYYPHFHKNDKSVYRNISPHVSEFIIKKDEKSLNYFYSLLKFFKEGKEETFGEFKAKLPKIDPWDTKTLAKFAEFNTLDGFYFESYQRDFKTEFAELSYVLHWSLLGGYNERLPKGFYAVLDGLKLEEWKRLIKISSNKKIRNVRTIVGLKTFIKNMNSDNNSPELLQDRINKLVLETLLRTNSNYTSSTLLFKMIMSKYDLNKVVDMEGLSKVIEVVESNKPTAFQLGVILSAIDNRTLWLRNSNVHNVYTLLSQILELDFKGGVEFMEFLLSDNKQVPPTATELAEFITEYSGEFELGMQGSIILSMITKNSEDNYSGPKVAFIRKNLLKLKSETSK